MSQCILDIESTSFLPWTGKIICIGVKDANDGETNVFYDEHEETLLMVFFRHMNKKKYTEIIGYNLSFDLRFIFARCLKYRLYANGFFNTKQTDLMMILKNINKGFNYNQPGTLNDWSQALLGKSKLFKNTEIPELYNQGKIEELIAYNKNDLELTYELWRRIKIVLSSSMSQ